MNRDEYERLKEAEKAHLRKVRHLKQQLTQAKRQQRLTEALRNLDMSGLDDEFERSLREVQEQNLTAEARYELAMDTLDSLPRPGGEASAVEAAEAERKRQEQARHEADLQKRQAADLVHKMKAQMLADAQEHTEAGPPSGAAPTDAGPAKTIGPDAPAPDDADPDVPAKSIGRFRRRGE